MSFALAAHEGSVRCLSVASAHVTTASASAQLSESNNKKRKRKQQEQENGTKEMIVEPGSMLSGGYDESIRIFHLHKHAEAGEFRSPSNLGTPTCSSFAPPSNSTVPSTHALVGLTSGKILLYRKKDWQVQHVLSGHEEKSGGVSCIAVHPSGKMALSGGVGDGRIVLWDLTKGRLAFVTKLPPLSSSKRTSGGRDVCIGHVCWSDDGNRYAFCRSNRVSVKDVGSGEDLLDVELPSRVNQVAFVGGEEGMFVAVACDDGSLPLLGVGNLSDSEEEAQERRAIMAIEPVDRLVAGEERFKCIESVKGGSGFLVVTANSGGVISVMDLEGGARMMLADDNDEEEEGKKKSDADSDDDEDVSSDEEEEDEDVAVEILESVRVGTGARVTNIAVWSYDDPSSKSLYDDDFKQLDAEDEVEEEKSESEEEEEEEEEEPTKGKTQMISTGKGRGNEIEMDQEALAKARELVSQAKKRQEKKKKQKKNKKKKKKET
uniref:Uncharacterized protein n=2 Tax=Ditylum brightwellii TaxID=49249 RepID=A0A7S4VDP2_9STRA